jgi:signal transduction histidine kinase
VKRPWQIWLAFVMCLAVVVPALVWLTRIALSLDYAQRLGRSQAELEEIVGNALWQIDTDVTREIAPETTRPYYMYRSIWPMPAADGHATLTVSPLLLQPSEFVHLHFQIAPNGQWSSPQVPDRGQEERVLEGGVLPEQLAEFRKNLDQLRQRISVEQIWEHFPAPAQMPPPLPEDVAQQTSAFGDQVVSNRAVENLLRDNADDPPSFETPHPPQGNTDQYAEQVQQSAKALRSGGNLRQRSDFVQAQAQQQSALQNSSYPQNYGAIPLQVTEGPTEIFWHDHQLLAARQTFINGEVLIQGCWFDWERLNERMIRHALDVLPSARVEPYLAENVDGPHRALAAVPARLVVPDAVVSSGHWSAIHWALSVAWSLLALAAISTAGLLHGVVALSERRAAFVSAVTHELRTPLTTFRLYSEMLAEGMVSEPRRRTYLETLQREAERLSHLVENVLQYARLERGAARRRREQIAVSVLMDRVAPALTRRAEQAEMKLDVSIPAELRQQNVLTDAAVVEQILFNLIDNACKYASTATDRRIECQVASQRDRVTLTVRDHGPGIDAKAAKRLFLPFHKSAQQAAESAPGVGLGLALCRRLVTQIGGKLTWQPAESGAAFQLSLPRQS